VVVQTSTDWSVTASPGLTSNELLAGIQALNKELAGGPGDAIASVLLQLISATSRPPWMDDAVASAYMTTMPKAMWDYPIDVVRSACANWRRVPQHGKWWPTEQDLRVQCEKLFESRRKLRAQAMKLLSDLEAQEEHAARMAQPSAFAGDACKSFKDAMKRRLRPLRYEAYFNADEIMYGNNTIICRSHASFNMVHEEGADLLKHLGLTVRLDPHMFRFSKPPRWEDETEEDRAEVRRKLRRLSQAMANGENIKALRKSGEI